MPLIRSYPCHPCDPWSSLSGKTRISVFLEERVLGTIDQALRAPGTYSCPLAAAYLPVTIEAPFTVFGALYPCLIAVVLVRGSGYRLACHDVQR